MAAITKIAKLKNDSISRTEPQILIKLSENDP